MDAGNPEQKAKKKQTPTQQPKQRFWPESIANIQPQLPGSDITIENKPDDEISTSIHTQPELQTESETTQIQTHPQIQSHPEVGSVSVPMSMAGVPVSIVSYNGQVIGTTASGIVLDSSGSMVTVPKSETTDTVTTESENS
ncbi:hypothetical protein LOTGIDRAFT_158100 [Lottia gigantea]|uniref:Uncharacterized protein n=1 Tax=Lottia gigantea TaxID=225164 RepID=V4CDG0_LOTGI|nr:hypothetical protein LOTGIDRAFT_158100 [Lottia gigantea]ESO99939.1 hypothetical protein LOTGIDRAFT_158100 [Lottia gigantea]